MLIYLFTAAFIYYTIWILIMPFVDGMNPTQKFFLDREWAIVVPVSLMLFGICLVGTFISLVMIKSQRKTHKT
ncbi:dolichol-phosphate mannosyltransferase subunit 2 [Schizosaccharomyces cryophilus OY26]|uniref:Dolichol phosphate-mannose biosynthesis regulatory protein n=1 Tax=Schizosaccharomyces cryophilus (strain OY26 / ATCC MYA-4695 / CBS 11777 / NBRC 106824 / NRRL Y48691) TaxID=653667 RepID=S9XEJ6_SCHCR|nr:dolichol-phosphate mannosyltransferase subunit 2 [Schizosaccharomyces cryophilus OY26]EPY52216.1 dolichol-phosphate mannosyltransferase subunit 2 [Schizosaccharomyces cryophilus OY26]